MPCNTRIRIEPRQQREQILFARGFGEDVGFGKNAQFGAGFFLAADIDLRGRVFAHAHEREARLHAARLERGDALREFALDLRGDDPSVNEVRRRYHLKAPWKLQFVKQEHDFMAFGVIGFRGGMGFAEGLNHLDALDGQTGVFFQRSSRPSWPLTMTWRIVVAAHFESGRRRVEIVDQLADSPGCKARISSALECSPCRAPCLRAPRNAALRFPRSPRAGRGVGRVRHGHWGRFGGGIRRAVTGVASVVVPQLAAVGTVVVVAWSAPAAR